MGTLRYDEIRTMQISHLRSVRFDGDEEVTKKLCDQIDEKVDAYVAGNLEHAAEGMSLLWEASTKGKSSTPTPQSTNAFKSPKSNDFFGESQPTSTFVCPMSLPLFYH